MKASDLRSRKKALRIVLAWVEEAAMRTANPRPTLTLIPIQILLLSLEDNVVWIHAFAMMAKVRNLHSICRLRNHTARHVNCNVSVLLLVPCPERDNAIIFTLHLPSEIDCELAFSGTIRIPSVSRQSSAQSAIHRKPIPYLHQRQHRPFEVAPRFVQFENSIERASLP